MMLKESSDYDYLVNFIAKYNPEEAKIIKGICLLGTNKETMQRILTALTSIAIEHDIKELKELIYIDPLDTRPYAVIATDVDWDTIVLFVKGDLKYVRKGI